MTIKNIVFDLGGVIMTIDQPAAVRRFTELGLSDAEERLDPYTQAGFFGDLEEGSITAEEFRQQLSQAVGGELTLDQCEYAWRGYVREVPPRNLKMLETLRDRGFRLILLSNTNPFMMHWALSDRFSGDGHSLADYFDALYLSFREKVMKPSERIYRKMLIGERIFPDETLFVDDSPRNVAAASELGIHTFCPENGADWTREIMAEIEAIKE